MGELSINKQSKTQEKPIYLDSKLSVDSTCSTRVNNSTDFSVYSSDSFDLKTTNVESTRSPASSIGESNNADRSNRSINTGRIPIYGQDRPLIERSKESSYTVMNPDYDYKRKRVMFDSANRKMIPEYVAEEIFNKTKYGPNSALRRRHNEYYYGPDVESITEEQKPVISKSLDEIMKNVNSNAYKVYEDDIMELEKSSKKMKYEEEEGYSQFDSNTSTVNSDTNSVADGVESGRRMESEEADESREERSSEARRVFKDIFDPKNWDKSWTIYTKPRKDRSAELVSELYVFMLQLKLLNSLELVRAVCRPWGVPPHGNDYVFHFDQIAGSGDLSLLQKYEEVFAPLYGKFKAGSPSVLWTRLADVDYFKIVFKLECIRFKQPFSSTIYENILRYTLSKLHASKRRSELGMDEDEEATPVGDLESLNNKHAMDEMNIRRKVCGLCGNIVKRECNYCASMDNSPSNRILINKVQVSTEEGTSSEFARNKVAKINGENKVLAVSGVDTGALKATSADAATIEANGTTVHKDQMALDAVTTCHDVIESAKYAAGGSVATAYVAGVSDAVVYANGCRSNEGKLVNGDLINGRDVYGRGSSLMTAAITDDEYGTSVLCGHRKAPCNEYNGNFVRLGGTGSNGMSNGDYHKGNVYALSSDGYYSSGKRNDVYEREGNGMKLDEVYDVSLSGGMQVRSIERSKSSEMDGDEWPERRLSETDGFILTSFTAANEYESPNVYKEDLATSFKYSAPSAAEKQTSGVTSAPGAREGVYTIMGSSQAESEDLTSNDNNTRLISSDLVDGSEVDVTTHSNLDFGEHFLDHTLSADACGVKVEGEIGTEEEDRKLKEAMVRNSVFRESVLKTNLFKDHPLTEDMLKKLDRDYSYNAYNRGYQSHYKKGEGIDVDSNGSNVRSNVLSEGLEGCSGIGGTRMGRSDREELGELSQASGVGVGCRDNVEVEGYEEGEYKEREEYLQYLSENYGLLDEEVLMRDEAILASLDEDMVNSEVTEEESYHQVSDQDIEKIVLSVLNRRISGDYTKYDQNPLMALYGSKSEEGMNTTDQMTGVGDIEGYGPKGSQAKKMKKKEDDYRNVDKYAYVENKYARMENRYNYMDYAPGYYTTSGTKEKKKSRDLDYEFPSFNRGKLSGKVTKGDKSEKAKKSEKQVKAAMPAKGDASKRKYELASPFKSHLANITRFYREGYYDDIIQPKPYAMAKDKEIKISSHVVSASVSYDKRQQRFMAQWKTREGTKHSKSFYAKRYASPIMARKHAELYKMYILQHRVMNASELVEPTYEQLLANNFKDLDSINVGELDYDL